MSETGKFSVGALVRCRERDWVVLPPEAPHTLLLRPIGGTENELCTIYLPLEHNDIDPAEFPLPDPTHAGDFVAGQLLHAATRLSLRSGAGPFRSLGRVSVRPRPYQFVPLIMALRLAPVRLLIADDVGIGKTIEAGLIVRELLDRRELRRLAVLCPPHLCDQWQRELREKFRIEAVIIRSSTIGALERALPHPDMSVFEHYPFFVASIDYVKSDVRKDSFLRTCPDAVIVDEAHTTALPAGASPGQQKRHDLVRAIAADPRRHLLLLTATPHSGIEDAFRSLLALLHTDFETLDTNHLSEEQRKLLARHFVQRRRADVLRWMDTDTPFPQREMRDATYSMPLTSPYRKLFDDVFGFARGLVESSATVPAARQRVRYWAALALLRCVMSSPAAAEAALNIRAQSGTLAADAARADQPELPDEQVLVSYVHDPTDQEAAQDTDPTYLVEQGSASSERARLREFARRAAALRGDGDPKLLYVVPLLNDLLRDGYNPLVFCRYIKTAEYLAAELRQRLHLPTGMELGVVTGDTPDREGVVTALMEQPRRLLVATDCLSEGVNLQHAFNAVVHYDLPWNPNRLEQREGRVDRYGQTSPTVRTALVYSEDNPIDAVVMRVLLRKAHLIHRTLGITVPLPFDTQQVVDALIVSLFTPSAKQLSLFEMAQQPQQLSLGDAQQVEHAIERAWQQVEQREKESRTLFAQRNIKPDEVQQALTESDAVLGDPLAVQRFVVAAITRLGGQIEPAEQGFVLHLNNLPDAIRKPLMRTFVLNPGAAPPTTVHVAFDSPAPEGVHVVGRTHPFVETLADYLIGTALQPASNPHRPAARTGAIRTAAVAKRTVLLLLRVRMLLSAGTPGDELLAEELVLTGYVGSAPDRWLTSDEARDLFQTATPTANIEEQFRQELIKYAAQEVERLMPHLRDLAAARAQQQSNVHERVRRTLDSRQEEKRPPLKVMAQQPPDVLGLYVLVPSVQA